MNSFYKVILITLLILNAAATSLSLITKCPSNCPCGCVETGVCDCNKTEK